MSMIVPAAATALPHWQGILATAAICWTVGALAAHAPDPRDMKGKDDE